MCCLTICRTFHFRGAFVITLRMLSSLSFNNEEHETGTFHGQSSVHSPRLVAHNENHTQVQKIPDNTSQKSTVYQ